MSLDDQQFLKNLIYYRLVFSQHIHFGILRRLRLVRLFLFHILERILAMIGQVFAFLHIL